MGTPSVTETIVEAWEKHLGYPNDFGAAPGRRMAVQSPIVEVETRSLRASDSPRISGENLEHAQALANMDVELPPIIVHRPTMRVIDGMHRLRAAELRKQENITVQFFDGEEPDAFVLAVKTNIAHGLPLSLTDRKTATARIIATHPHWSDRMIASVTGLAAKTVAEIRKQPGNQFHPAQRRVGQDGRVRPVNSAEGRRRAVELIQDNPRLSLRQVARAAGISPETVRNVRSRLRDSEPPRVPRQRVKITNDSPEENPKQANITPPILGPDTTTEIKRLRVDPALRFSETGRALLRMLDACAIDAQSWEDIADNIPSHALDTVARVVQEHSDAWKALAERVAHNARNTYSAQDTDSAVSKPKD